MHCTYVSDVECGARNRTIDLVARLTQRLGQAAAELLRDAD